MEKHYVVCVTWREILHYSNDEVGYPVCQILPFIFKESDLDYLYKIPATENSDYYETKTRSVTYHSWVESHLLTPYGKVLAQWMNPIGCNIVDFDIHTRNSKSY